jgi:hypothetical protein
VVSDPAGASAQDTVLVNIVDTTPPVVNCPSAMRISAGEDCEALVPDLVAGLSVSDSCATSLSAVQNPPAGTVVGSGNYEIVLTVTDPSGNQTRCSTILTVADTTAPVLTCPANVHLSLGTNGRAILPDLLADLAVSENCTPDDQLVQTQVPLPGTLLGAGEYAVTLTATDASGNSSSCTVMVTVRSARDKTPPVIRSISATPSCLFPVNRKLVPVRINVVARDNMDPSPQCRIVSVRVNQKNHPCDHTKRDWVVTGDLSLKLRAENYSHREMRVYTIKVACTDNAGNRSTKTVKVIVRKQKQDDRKK